MSRDRSSLWKVILTTSIISSATTVVVTNLIQPEPAVAQANQSMSNIMFSANGRRDTDKNECYIFFDPVKSELWFYRDEKCERHLRLNELGKPLEEIK